MVVNILEQKDLNTDCCPLHDPCHGRGELIEDGSCKCFDGRDKGKVNKYCTKKYINTNNYNIDCCPKKIKKKDECGNKKKKPISKDLLDPESLLKPIVLLKKEKKEETKKEEKEEIKKEEKEETKKEEESVKKVSVNTKKQKNQKNQKNQNKNKNLKKKCLDFPSFLL